MSQADIDRLVLTKDFDRLLSLVAQVPSFYDATWTPIVNALLTGELEQRIAAFEEAYQALDTQIERWSKTSTFLVFDTGVYIKAPVKLADLDIKQLLGINSPTIQLVVPIVVVDELDRLKEHSKEHVRWRARHAVAVIDRVLQGQTALQGDATIEILHDPPGHIRLPIEDNEIIDRTLAITPLTTTPPTLVTYDTGQSLRAREADVPVIKLELPDEPEPPVHDPATPSRREQRRQRRERNEANADSNQTGSIRVDTPL